MYLLPVTWPVRSSIFASFTYSLGPVTVRTVRTGSPHRSMYVFACVRLPAHMHLPVFFSSGALTTALAYFFLFLLVFVAGEM